MDIIDPQQWQIFLTQVKAMQAEGLTGDALWNRVEEAQAPMLEGVPDDCGAIVIEAVLGCLYQHELITLEEYNP